MQKNSTGTATPIINKTLFENLSIPLPPLKEQEYIAHTLDTLFTLTKGLNVSNTYQICSLSLYVMLKDSSNFS